MKPNRIKLLYFSPTGTTRRVLEGITKGFSSGHVESIDLTTPKCSEDTTMLDSSDIVIIGAPVYAGRISIDAVKRLKQFQGMETPAVLIVVYGNREFEDALLELKLLAMDLGFKPIAGAAFIGEHSFETVEKPVAKDRPDKTDISIATEFGQLIEEKMRLLERDPDRKELEVPGNIPHRDGAPAMHIAPETDTEVCLLCGECVGFCPTNAISLNGALKTDVTLCIRCSACIKKCPEEARSWQNEKIQTITDWLHENFSHRKEPEFFGV